MRFGMEQIAGYYYRNQVNQERKTAGQKRGADFNDILSAQGAATAKAAWKPEETGTANVEAYKAYLKEKYGANVAVRDVGKDQKSIDALGAGTAGFNNVVIAPNILEKMENDPEKAAYYEGKIKQGLDGFRKCQAELSAAGHEIHSYGVVVHSDGTVYTYVCGDLKPEVRAKIEAQVKAEQEEKAARRRAYMELSQEAAEKRRLYQQLFTADYHSRLVLRESGAALE